jgi:histone deacetylase 8
MAIPEHAQWPKYAPSFTMEIEKGNMADENGEEYLEEIGQRFRAVADRIRRVDSINRR